ncbi:hypothetical protein SALBM311S_06894 [Streptomyces alboniger]
MQQRARDGMTMIVVTGVPSRTPSPQGAGGEAAGGT